MKVAVVYVYPMTGEPRHDDYAVRFLHSYQKNQTDIDHQTVVVCNAGKVSSEVVCMFSVLRNCTLLEHDDSGWDIGAHQLAARTIECDLMVFLGGSIWIKGPYWLERIVQSYQKHGDALYGVMGNSGHVAVGVYPHIRTTGYWMPPRLMNEYPFRVNTTAGRYPFEHGSNCLTSWILSKGYKALVVTWAGEYELPMWDSIPNGYHRGNQSALIFGDRISDPPFHPIA